MRRDQSAPLDPPKKWCILVTKCHGAAHRTFCTMRTWAQSLLDAMIRPAEARRIGRLTAWP